MQGKHPDIVKHLTELLQNMQTTAAAPPANRSKMIAQWIFGLKKQPQPVQLKVMATDLDLWD